MKTRGGDDNESHGGVETSVSIGESVRGCDAFVVQSGCGNVNDACMEVFILAAALKSASARRVVAVLPYYPYSKQVRLSHLQLFIIS